MWNQSKSATHPNWISAELWNILHSLEKFISTTNFHLIVFSTRTDRAPSLLLPSRLSSTSIATFIAHRRPITCLLFPCHIFFSCARPWLSKTHKSTLCIASCYSEFIKTKQARASEGMRKNNNPKEVRSKIYLRLPLLLSCWKLKFPMQYK